MNFFADHINKRLFPLICFGLVYLLPACKTVKNLSDRTGLVRLVPVDSGWAKNSVNTAIFRKNSLVSRGDSQYIAFYNDEGFVVLGKRRLGSDNWQLEKTSYRGNAADAHNVISIMVDGDGFLHMAWDHHNNRLHYARSLFPGSLEPGPELPMTGNKESRVSYPEFYRMPDGNLLFFYRDGGSGNGNLVINHYDTKIKQWRQVQSNLIDGEGQRNAYWQACVDEAGTIHISWVWRESPDVASNHDLCYARSADGGMNWEKSTGEKYTLPITAANAETIALIPQKSELINQTSMFADEAGHPFIASYWREAIDAVPQYHIVYKTGKNWQTLNLGFRKTAFSLSGAGTKRIPVSRPQVIAWNEKGHVSLALIFRDEERASRVSVAVCTDISKPIWKVTDLDSQAVGSWEPTYDTELWKQKHFLHLFVQKVEQVDAEGQASLPPQMIQVLEWNPIVKK